MADIGNKINQDVMTANQAFQDVIRTNRDSPNVIN